MHSLLKYIGTRFSGIRLKLRIFQLALDHLIHGTIETLGMKETSLCYHLPVRPLAIPSIVSHVENSSNLKLQ